MSLDQLLTGAPENTPQPDAPVEPQTEQQPVEAPAEPPQGETPATPPVAEPVKTVPLAALEDERRKRKEFEQRLKQYEQQAPQPQQEQPKGFWDDPEGHLARVQQAARYEALAAKLDITEEFARSKYSDFDEKLEVFKEMASKDPQLFARAVQARNPAEFAYSTAKNFRAYEEAGTFEERVSKRLAEERVKWEAESKAKAEAEALKRAAIPQTLTAVQSGSPRTPEDVDEPPLDAIVKNRT